MADVLERERKLAAQERLSWARFEGAVPSPTLVEEQPYDPYSLMRPHPPSTPPRWPHSGRTRRSLEEELRAAEGNRAPADLLGTGGDARVELDPFDRALFGLSSELDPWTAGPRAQLSMCDYSEFRSVTESFRRWRMLAAAERTQRLEYSWALRRYKLAVKHHMRDLLAKGWVSWEVRETLLPNLRTASSCS